MSNFSNLDPLHIQKIFEVYQFKDFLSFTDSLRICASLKVFPDLLTSQDIRKIFVGLVNAGSEKMSYSQFEVFLKVISKQAFRHCKKKSEDCSRLISYIKAATSKQFTLKSSIIPSSTLQKPFHTQKSPFLTVSTPKSSLRTTLFQTSEKSLSSSSLSKKLSTKVFKNERKKGFLGILSPVMRKYKEKMNENKFLDLTERRNRQISVNSLSPSVDFQTIDKISGLFSDFQGSIAKIPKSRFKGEERLKQVVGEYFGIRTQPVVKLAFRWWKLVANELHY